MKPAEFLSLASRLALFPSSGAGEFRTAISRAYYAVFLAAREVLNDRMQFFCKSENVHQWVQRHFANCTSDDARDVGRILQNMHHARKRADYDLSDADIETGDQARLSLEQAQIVLKLLDHCQSLSTLPTTRAEMLEYRRRANVQ